MRVHYLQHVPYEDPGSLLPYFRSNHCTVTGSHIYLGETCLQPSEYDFLLIMGGPMNIYQEDEYPWLKQEKESIRRAIASGKKVLGICLGAQLIADALGARVHRNRYHEIGWFSVSVTPEASKLEYFTALPEHFDAFHWHGDTFEIPDGAIHLFRSEACANQGFLYQDRVLALQFHLETTPELANGIIQHSGIEGVGGRYVQTAEQIRAENEKFIMINNLAAMILEGTFMDG